MKTSRIIISSFLVVGATFLFAETLPSYGPVPFSSYDTNGDSKISQEEFDAIKAQRMSSKAEQGRLMKNAAISPQFADVDANGDGIISQEELRVHQQNRFSNRMNQKQMIMKKGNGMKGGMGQGMGPGNGMRKGMAQ